MPDEHDSPDSQILQRKLSTILSADVAGFSRLMGEDEEQTLRIFRGHKQVFESLVAMHGGRIFNTAGDAILAEFVSAVEAVRCATDIQSALRTRNDQIEPSRQVRFRIGINLGDVMVQGEDLMGDGVNVAARLQTAAEPGGVCISGSVHDQIRDKLSLSFTPLGERNFKNIQQPVRTFSIADTEGGGVLPAPKPRSFSSVGGAKWAAAGLVLAALAGGGYWAFRGSQRSSAEPPRANTAPPAQTAASTAPPAAAQPVTTASAAPSAVPEPAKTAGPAQPTSRASAAAAEPPQKAPPVSRTPPEPSSSAAAGPYDGQYAGPVCLARTPMRPERCYRAEATVEGRKITGQWQVPREPGVTMHLTGEVTRTGEVTMEMRSERSDGALVATIDVTGAFHGRVFDGSGSFRNGRSVRVTWRKKAGAAR